MNNVNDDMFRNYFFDIVDQAQVGITISDPNQEDNPIIYVNQAFCDIFKYTYDEVVGRNCRFLQGEDRDQKELEEIREAIKNQTSISVILRNYTKNAQLIYNEIKISPVFDIDTKKIKYFLGVQKNISDVFNSKKHYLDSMYERISYKTNAKPLEGLTVHDYKEVIQDLQIYQSELLAQNNELQEKEEKVKFLNYELNSLFQNAPLPLILIDESLQIKRFNIMANEYFKFDKVKTPIKSLFRFITKEYIQKFISWVHNKEYVNDIIEINMLLNGIPNRFKIQLKTYSLNENWFIVSLVHIQDEYEIKINLEKKVQEELKKREEHEKIIIHQSKLASMGEMIDAIAHQWKQPLNTISLRADYLVTMNENKECIPMVDAIECKESITRQVKHLLSTMQQFRDFLRPDTKKVKFNLENSIKSVLLLTKDQFISNQIKINTEFEKEVYIYGIENEFMHVVLNILNNAEDIFIERNCQNRIIDIVVKKIENKVIVMIQDNAGGIAENIIEHIFENHISGKKEGSGTGIGLYMSKQIMDKIGAEIFVENKNRGACFTLIFR